MLRTRISIVLAIILATVCLALATAPALRAQFTANRAVVKDVRYSPTPHDYAIALAHQARYFAVKSGILECSSNAEDCAIANMPLLAQGDPLIDADVQSNSNYGCYDTSIVTVILASLANRNPNLQPQGRTKSFMDIPAGVDSHGKPVPKEIKQLSQQYRWQIQSHYNLAKPPQPYFMTEVVGDLGAIKQSCNPLIYRNCAEDSNSVARAFSTAVTGTDLKNLRVINLMKAGYAPLIAYQRWTPSLTKQTDGTRSATFVYNGHHKVAFSGFQRGAYPLLINDVGSGQQFRVRLSSDLSRRLGAQLKSVAYPLPAQTFLEYEGRSAPEDDVLFVEGFDGIRINPANSTPFPITQPENAIATDLFSKGCKAFLGRTDGEFLCMTDIGQAACLAYQKKDQAASCLRAK